MRWTLCPDARGERPAAPRGAPARRAACAVRTPSPQKSHKSCYFISFSSIKFQGIQRKKAQNVYVYCMLYVL